MWLWMTVVGFMTLLSVAVAEGIPVCQGTVATESLNGVSNSLLNLFTFMYDMYTCSDGP